MCGALLAGGTAANDEASYQVLAIVCERCRQGFIEGGGVRVAVGDADRDRAECDSDSRHARRRGDEDAHGEEAQGGAASRR